jgi:NAD(P)-dependent dehydrogenase (short-subunit alcohol dehydrogenase family)
MVYTPPMKNALSGRAALVTGAASGIGRALSGELARRGAALLIADIDGAGLTRAEAELRAAGARVSAEVADVADPAAIDRLARAAEATLGRVDILFNNAGVAVAGPVEKMRPSDWEWIVGVNLFGPVRLTQALLPGMLARRRGHIVNTASRAGLVGAPGMAAYSLTKFGLVGFSEALRLEVSGRGVDVTVICPGYVRTGLAAATRYRDPALEGFLGAAPAWYGVSAERAARRIVEGVLRREAVVTLGPERAGWLLKRVSPEAAFRATRFIARRLGLLEGA